MKVTISLTDREPPVGTVQVDGGQAIDFSGWLGLLGVLGGVVDLPSAEDVAGAALDTGLDQGVAQPTQIASADHVTRGSILQSGEG